MPRGIWGDVGQRGLLKIEMLKTEVMIGHFPQERGGTI